MSKVYLIGVAGDRLGSEAELLIGGCETVFCSTRHRQCFDFGPKRILPLTPLSEMLDKLKQQVEQHNVAVLASGDPLYFGIGRRILAHLGEEKITVFPALSSMQLAASRFRIPWDDAVFISLHGRGGPAEYGRLLKHPKAFVLTDAGNSPNVVARHLQEIFTECGAVPVNPPIIHVAENLGLPGERCVSGTPAQISEMTFGALNIMAIINQTATVRGEIVFGLGEEEIFHSRGLITKSEVRAATLHALRLPSTGVLWDIGAGSGSITIEAAGLRPDLRIFAIERNAEQLANVRQNRQKFGAFNVDIVDGEAPAALHELPDPDRVFIGGSGGNMEQIVKICSDRLTDNGLIVVNGVIEKTKSLAPKLLFEVGLKVTISEVSVTRFGYPAEGNERLSFNPISIMCGAK